jgi:hypothetical protein
MLRNIFGSRRDEVAGEWGKWHTEDCRDPYFLPSVILVIISRKTKCVGMRRGWGRGILWFLVGNEPLENPRY